MPWLDEEPEWEELSEEEREELRKLAQSLGLTFPKADGESDPDYYE